jgi:hypothetical protein
LPRRTIRLPTGRVKDFWANREGKLPEWRQHHDDFSATQSDMNPSTIDLVVLKTITVPEHFVATRTPSRSTVPDFDGSTARMVAPVSRTVPGTRDSGARDRA